MDTQDTFDYLLGWLDTDREAAGRKYRLIHAGLVRIFVSRGFCDAEDLADRTIVRVTELLHGIREGYVGEPARYFYKVARYIMLEAARRPEIATDVFPADASRESEGDETDETYEHLLKCLDLLPAGQRDMILDYHLYKGRDKIEHHKQMARERGISVGALRSRAHHIREALEKCVRGMMREQ